MTSYLGLFGQTSFTGDTLTSAEVIVTDLLDQSGAQWNMTQVDNSTITFSNNQLSVLAASIDSSKLAPLSYVPFIDSSVTSGAHIGSTYAFINQTGNKPSTKFIMQDSSSGQQIGSALTLDGTLNLAGYSTNGILSLNNTGNVVSTNLTNGQLMIGSSGSAPVASTLTGTLNQVNVTNGTGSITLSTPQNIDTNASFVINNLTTTAGTSSGGITHQKFQAGPSNSRWVWSLIGTETGSNAGSNLLLSAFDDTSNFLGNWLEVVRSDGRLYSQYQNILDRSAQLIFGDLNTPLNHYQTTFDVTCPSAGSTTIHYRLISGTDDYVVYESLSQTIANKTLTSPTINGGTLSGNFTASSFKLSGSPQQIGGGTDLIGINMIPTFPLDVTGSARFNNDCYVVGNFHVGASDGSKDINIVYSQANGYGSIDSYASGGKPLFINPNSGLVSISNSNLYVTPTQNTGGKLIIFGSGTSNTNSDILKIRENTNTNPHEIYLGYNTGGDYGIIQSGLMGVGYRDTYISPNGGNLRIGGGYYVPNPQGGTTQLFDTFEFSTFTLTMEWASTPAASASYIFYYAYYGSSSLGGGIVTLNMPAISLSNATNLTGTCVSTSAMPSRLQLSGISSSEIGHMSGNVGGVFNNFKVIVSNTGIITIANFSGSSNNIGPATSFATNNASFQYLRL